MPDINTTLISIHNASVMELVDMADSKSAASDSVAVQVRPLVPNIKPTFQLVFLCLNFNKSPRERGLYPINGGSACRPSVGPSRGDQSKPAHWYQTLSQPLSCFFVLESQQIATQACRPSVGPSHSDQSLFNKAPQIDLDESCTCESSGMQLNLWLVI